MIIEMRYIFFLVSLLRSHLTEPSKYDHKSPKQSNNLSMKMVGFSFTLLVVVSVLSDSSGRVTCPTDRQDSLSGYLLQAGIAAKSLDVKYKKSKQEMERLKCTLAKVQAKLSTIQSGIASKPLEDRIDSLNISYRILKEKYEKSQEEIESLKRSLAQVQVTKLNNTSGWKLVRVDKALSQLAKIQLHLKKPTYIQQLPIVPPRNTKAIIISVFTNFWNGKGHAYLNFKTYQKRNERNGSVAVVNQHYNIYANTFYYELMLPWDTSLPNELVLVVTDSYLTGGNNNYYQFKLVGYITA